MCAETYNQRLVRNRLMHFMCSNCDLFRWDFKVTHMTDMREQIYIY